MYHDVIGVLGGMGSFATLHFFEELLKAFPAEKEWDRPRILIDNRCTMPSRVLAVLEGKQYNQLVEELSDSVRSLLSAGATKIILACNTSHCFLNDIYHNVLEAEGKIINIIEACCKEIADAQETKVSLIASEGTIQTGVFSDSLALYGISLKTPENEQYSLQRELIEAVKQDRITPDVIQKFVDLVISFSDGAIILGCTEFPVLYSLVPKGTFENLRIYDPLMSVIHVLKKECH